MLKLNLKRHQNIDYPYAIDKFKDTKTVIEYHQLKLDNRFEHLHTTTSIEEWWVIFEQVVTDSADEMIGHK